jgi:hypothetical protein
LSSQQAADAERARLAQLEQSLKAQVQLKKLICFSKHLHILFKAQQLASQQEQMTRQQQLEAIEKVFAEQANSIDRFILEEEKKVNTISCNLCFVVLICSS